MTRKVQNAKSIQAGKPLVGELVSSTEAKALSAVTRALPAQFAARIGAGRPKGAKNKATRQLKEILHKVYTGIGGDTAFVTWARANRTEFYKLFTKQLPLDARAAAGDGSIHIHIAKEDLEV